MERFNGGFLLTWTSGVFVSALIQIAETSEIVRKFFRSGTFPFFDHFLEQVFFLGAFHYQTTTFRFSCAAFPVSSTLAKTVKLILSILALYEYFTDTSNSYENPTKIIRPC